MIHQRRETELLGWVIWHDGDRYIGENAFPTAAVVELASTRLHRVTNAIRAIHARREGGVAPFWSARWLADPEPARIDLDAARDPTLDRSAGPGALQLRRRRSAPRP